VLNDRTPCSETDQSARHVPGRMGYHMSNNLLLASLASPKHPHLDAKNQNQESPDWLSLPNKPKRILICDPSQANLDMTLKRMREEMQGGHDVEIGVVDSEPLQIIVQIIETAFEVSKPPSVSRPIRGRITGIDHHLNDSNPYARTIRLHLGPKDLGSGCIQIGQAKGQPNRRDCMYRAKHNSHGRQSRSWRRNRGGWWQMG
jgi:hypothetical protein